VNHTPQQGGGGKCEPTDCTGLKKLEVGGVTVAFVPADAFFKEAGVAACSVLEVPERCLGLLDSLTSGKSEAPLDGKWLHWLLALVEPALAPKLLKTSLEFKGSLPYIHE